MTIDGDLRFSATVKNTGGRPASEVVQLYVHQKTASVARPVKELKGFQRVFLAPGESKRVTFKLEPDDLKFHNAQMKEVFEPGEFEVWIAKDSASGKAVTFKVIPYRD